MNRRDFLHVLTAAAAGAALPAPAVPFRDRLGPVLPRRPLGRDGPLVTCLGLGGFHIGWTDERSAQATVEAALSAGVRFFDTAESYGPHMSEERYGRWLAPHRDVLFLMTKTLAPNAATARAHLEGSLRRLRCDTIDLWQLHALSGPEDAEGRLANGVLDEALRARAEGKVRRIGMTTHAQPEALLRVLERTKDMPEAIAAGQFPVNPVDAADPEGFVARLLPVAHERGLGVLAMKTLADGRFFAVKDMPQGRLWATDDPVVPQVFSVSDATRFALSLPVSVLIVGAEKPEYLLDKVAVARNFTPLTPAEMTDLTRRAARFAAPGTVEYYKRRPASAAGAAR